MNGTSERSVVIALFKEKSKVQKAVAKDGAVAAQVESVADEAVIVTKNADDTLTISRSKHSVGRSLATMTAKLMIAVPLGFHGVVAVSVANAEIITAKRKRSDPTYVEETDLAFLVEQMKPGWSALLAVYPEKYIGSAVKAFQKLGAKMVWHASESQIEAAVRQNRIDE